MSVVVRAAIDANLIITDKNLAPRVPSHPKRGILIFNCMYTVYMHICPNGKKYIGITSKSPKERWKNNGSGYSNNNHFWSAIKLYGWENIEHKIIATGLEKAEACQLEKQLIKDNMSNIRDYGYNKSDGGEYPASGFHHSEAAKASMSKRRKGIKFSKEHAEKISKALTGIKRSEETKQKLRELRTGTHASDELRKHFSETRKGKLNPRYGAVVSKETRNKISAALKGRKISDYQKKLASEIFRKPILCVETGLKYRSIKEAALDVGVHPSCISGLLHGKQKTVKGMHFILLDKEKERLERGDFDDNKNDSPVSSQPVP